MASMVKVVTLALVLATGSPPRADAAEGELSFHCAGKSWQALGNGTEVPTDAIFRIGQGIYISVSAVGSGQSAQPPRPVTEVESVGPILLQPIGGGEPIDAWFSINRYTGELVVAPRLGGGKVLFVGTCKKPDPLF